MFATLLGALPAPPAEAGDPLAAGLRAQAEGGLAPLTDGGPAWRVGGAAGDATGIVARWQAAAARTALPLKAVLAGPYSLARVGWPGSRTAPRARGAPAPPRHRASDALALAEGIREAAVELAAAGCPFVEIEETLAHEIGDDAAERAAFAAAHRRIADGLAGTHLALSIVGGSAWTAGAATILDAPYASLAVDLIAGPDNWRLVAEAPRERGVVVGVIGARSGVPDGLDVLLYAAHYAASTRGRGQDRVGLGTAGSLASLSWSAAIARLERLGEAARLAATPADRQAAAMDPRAVSSRAAALGRTGRAGAPPRAAAPRRTGASRREPPSEA